MRRALVSTVVVGGLLFGTTACLGGEDDDAKKPGATGGGASGRDDTSATDDTGDTGDAGDTDAKNDKNDKNGDDKNDNNDRGEDDKGGDGKPGKGELRVTGVYLTVAPGTLSGIRCQTAFMASYNGVITFAEGHKGGKITISYGGGSGSMKEEEIDVPAGKKSVNKSFGYSEFLYGASIAAAQVNVLEPNRVASATVRPTGSCTSGGTWGSTTGTTTGTTSGSGW